MSYTTLGGPVILLANHPVTPEDNDHVHTAQHALVSHSHVSGTDDLALKNLHVKPDGQFDNVVKVSNPGIVSENVTVTEVLDVIHDAFLRVQPHANNHETAVLIGFDPNQMTDEDTGVFVHRGKDVITMNHRVGIRAPGHSIESANFQSERNVDAYHDVNAGNAITAPQLRTTNIRLYADGHTRLKIEAPIVLEKGGINVSNLGGDTIHSLGTAGLKLDFKMGDLACRNLYASGKCVLGTFEQESRNHEDGKHLHVKSLTVDSHSMYLGLMRRSYNVATHKPDPNLPRSPELHAQ